MSKRPNITGQRHNRWGSLGSKLWVATTLVAFLFPLGVIVNPAHAASQTVAIDCSTSVTVATTPVALQVGDTLTINSSNCLIVNLAPGAVGVATYGPSGTGSTVNPGAPNALANGDTVIYTATAVGAAFLDVVNGSPPKGVAYSITVNAPAPAPAPASDDGGPEPVLQQFGKTVAGTCAATAPESLNWAGVSSGGWGESWAQWVNGGNGGAVCTRTLIYSTAQSRWIVG